MRKSLGIVCVAACLAVWVGPARAAPTTITFEALPDVPFYMYTDSGVTFRAVDGGLLKRDETPNGSWGLRAVVDPYPEMRADFAGGAKSVSVDLGDFANIDSETVFLEIFSASGTSLGFVSEDVPIDRMGMTRLTLSGPCFDYAVFGARNSSIGNGSSVRADNFTFEPCTCPSAVPAPGALLLGAMGAGLVGRLRRRRVL
ncbi:MAG: hypothetical protein ABFE01_22940 [Phycisphaerales bacterium]|jgi:hypothetical protein